MTIPQPKDQEQELKERKKKPSLKSVLSKQKIDLTSFSNHKHKFGVGWALFCLGSSASHMKPILG